MIKRRQTIALLALLTMAALSTAGIFGVRSVMADSGARVSGRVTFTDSSGETIVPEEKAVIYIKGVPNALPDTSEMKFSVKQKDTQFAPGFIVALKGSTVEFPNEDRIDHNVFSLSSTARFDLGLYRSGKMKSVQMRRAGLIDVYCNIHPQMAAKILVLDTRYYAIANKDGTFTIPAVPDGNYEIVAWQPYGEEAAVALKVAGGKADPVDFRLLKGKAKKRHTRKDGTPYGRYK